MAYHKTNQDKPQDLDVYMYQEGDFERPLPTPNKEIEDYHRSPFWRD